MGSKKTIYQMSRSELVDHLIEILRGIRDCPAEEIRIVAGLSRGGYRPIEVADLKGPVARLARVVDEEQRQPKMAPEFLYITTVPAPQCETCQEPMLYTKKGTYWSCQKKGCPASGKSVLTDVGGIISDSGETPA